MEEKVFTNRKRCPLRQIAKGIPTQCSNDCAFAIDFEDDKDAYDCAFRVLARGAYLAAMRSMGNGAQEK